MKIKVGDQVVVIAGKNKGKTGKVTRTDRENDMIIVDKVNMVTRHMKKGAHGPGQKIEKEAPIHVSNVMIVDPETKKRSRIGYRVLKSGEKERYSKASGKAI